MIDWRSLLEMQEKQRNLLPSRRPNTLCLDPGYTMGWCTFVCGEFNTSGQVTLVKEEVIHWDALVHFLDYFSPDIIVCEDYRVYAHKLDRHINSPVLTLRIIGAIECYAAQKGIPLVFQMAATAKGFVTDEKLKDWNLYTVGGKHARDAIRHGCYYTLFGRKS